MSEVASEPPDTAAPRAWPTGTGAGVAWEGLAESTDDEPALTPAGGRAMARRARALVAGLIRPHRRRVLVAMLVQVAETAVTLVGPLIIAAAIDVGIPAALAGRPGVLAWSIAGYALTGLASGGLRALFTLLAGRIGQDVLIDLRGRVFRHGQRLSLDFHESFTSGRLISRLTSDLDSLDELLEKGLDGLIGSALSIVGITALMVWLDPLLAAVVLAGFVPLALATRWFQRSSRATYRRTRTAVARLIVAFVESMNGIRAVAAYGRERRNEQIMHELAGSYRAANTTALRQMAWYTGTLSLMGGLTLGAVLLVGAARVIGGGVELGTVTAFVLYVRRVYDPLDELAQFFNSYQSAAAACEKIAAVLDTAPGVEEPVDPVPLPVPTPGDLRFDAVRFAYRRATDRTILPTFDLHVPAGQTVALVGATGAGKSTLAKLAARFYDPSAGSVALDGIDLRDIADTDLRRALVMITQEAFLFSGSVAENIELGRPGASRAEVVAAAEAVGAAGFVEALPDGFDTDVRKRGGRLSAGQRQLVSLARVVLADPAVVLLDEATSSLDVPSERAVQAALETVLAGRTALIIAHRLSTVLIADRVLVLAEGRVREDGTPQELLAAGGEFAALHSAWRASLT